MTIEQFLQNLLYSQELKPDQEATLQAHKKEVTDYLQSEFGTAPVIKYAGSYEKGTLISENYDLDIVCYFPSTDNRTLKEIREDVSSHLQKKYLIEEKASAARILNMKEAASSDYHVDVVPGRFIEGTKDVFLYVASGDKERMQTNLKTHIDYITNSGCIDTIRLTKLWAHRNNLSIRTFILELFVIQSLIGFQNKTSLKESFLKVLEAFKDSFGKTQLIDPANTNNVVSKLITPEIISVVTQTAERALSSISNSDTENTWHTIFLEISNTPSAFTPSARPTLPHNQAETPRAFTPRSPWSLYDNGTR